MMLRRLLTILFLAAFLRCSEAADKAAKTVWAGAYTAAQADRGQAAYGRSCMRCHGEDLTKSGDVLVGPKFLDHWREDTVKNLFTILKDSMPRNAPRSLSDAQYL